MKLVIRITSKIRSMAPQPRGFMPIAGLEHLGLVYEQRIFASADDFNAAQEQLRDPQFKNRGCEFAAYALTVEDERKIVPEVKTAKAALKAVESSPEVVVSTPSPEPENKPSEAPDEAPAQEFTMDGTRIMLGNERVAGLFGDDKHLRVAAAFADLRPAIETWLESTKTSAK